VTADQVPSQLRQENVCISKGRNVRCELLVFFMGLAAESGAWPGAAVVLETTFRPTGVKDLVVWATPTIAPWSVILLTSPLRGRIVDRRLRFEPVRRRLVWLVLRNHRRNTRSELGVSSNVSVDPVILRCVGDEQREVLPNQ
jgi:hypothetical protein